jgi:ATP-dependent DNA helicase RecG
VSGRPAASSGASGSRARVSLVELSKVGVDALLGVGPRRARAFGELGVTSVAELLMLFPRRHVDRSVASSVEELESGVRVAVAGVIEEVAERRARTGRSFVEAQVRLRGGRLRAVFFNQPWQRRRLVPGTEASLFGAVERFGGRLQMTNPLVDLVGEETGGLVPIYAASERSGVESRDVAKAVRAALASLGRLEDPLPEAVRERLKLPDRDWAVRNLHFPLDGEAERRSRRRLLFDEVLRVQSALALARAARLAEPTGERKEILKKRKEKK